MQCFYALTSWPVIARNFLLMKYSHWLELNLCRTKPNLDVTWWDCFILFDSKIQFSDESAVKQYRNRDRKDPWTKRLCLCLRQKDDFFFFSSGIGLKALSSSRRLPVMYRLEKRQMSHEQCSGTQQPASPGGLVAVKQHGCTAAKFKSRHPRRWGSEHPLGERQPFLPGNCGRWEKRWRPPPNVSS